MPQVGPGGQRLAQVGEQLVGLERAAGVVAIVEQAVAKDHLLHKLVLDEPQHFAALGHGVAQVDQVGNGVVVIDRQLDRLAERLASLGQLVLRTVQVCLAAGRYETLIGSRRPAIFGFGPGFAQPPLASQQERQLAMNPGVVRIARQ